LAHGRLRLAGWVPARGADSLAGMGNAYRCGKHAVLANPASRIPVWMGCAVHRFTPMQVERRFTELATREFSHEETRRLGRIVEHAML
jgi:hypothetical protein